MQTLIAIDPGPERSAWVELYGDVPGHAEILPNAEVRQRLRECSGADRVTLVVEMIASYGMPVGADVFETCVWIGRFIEAWDGPHERVFRKDVKMHLCASTRAKDSNIRQALIDRYGPGRDKAIGTKKAPGPCYGFAKDLWAALAVGVTYADQGAV